MIVMYTNYNRIAAALAECATLFLDAHGTVVTARLAPGAAEWGNPHDWVRSNPGVPMLFFGHGVEAPAAFLSQTEAPFMDASSSDLLAGRFVCGVCCHSAGLGAHAAPVGATVVGYQGRMGVSVRPRYAKLLADCVMAGLDRIVARDTAQAICRATRVAFESAAQVLLKGSSLDCFVAPVFQGNAKALTVVGDAGRRP